MGCEKSEGPIVVTNPGTYDPLATGARAKPGGVGENPHRPPAQKAGR